MATVPEEATVTRLSVVRGEKATHNAAPETRKKEERDLTESDILQAVYNAVADDGWRLTHPFKFRELKLFAEIPTFHQKFLAYPPFLCVVLLVLVALAIVALGGIYALIAHTSGFELSNEMSAWMRFYGTEWPQNMLVIVLAVRFLFGGMRLLDKGVQFGRWDNSLDQLWMCGSHEAVVENLHELGVDKVVVKVLARKSYNDHKRGFAAIGLMFRGKAMYVHLEQS